MTIIDDRSETAFQTKRKRRKEKLNKHCSKQSNCRSQMQTRLKRKILAGEVPPAAPAQSTSRSKQRSKELTPSPLYLPPPLIMNIASFLQHHMKLRLINRNWNEAIVSMHDCGVCTGPWKCHAECYTLQELVARRERLNWIHSWSIRDPFEIRKSDIDYCSSMFAAKHWQSLKSVKFPLEAINARQIPNLLAAPFISSVTKLDISFGRLFEGDGHRMAIAFNSSPMLKHLTSLRLCYIEGYCDGPYDAADEQAEASEFLTEFISNCAPDSNLVNLTELLFVAPGMNEKQIIDFCSCPAFANLKTLRITGDDFTEKALSAIGASPYLTKLEDLTLVCDRRKNAFDPKGIEIAGASANFTSLKSLTLMGKTAVAAVFNSPSLSNLRTLSLWSELESEDLKLHSSRLTSLTNLDLSNNKLDSSILPLIASTSFFKSLKQLHIDSYQMEFPKLWKESAEVKENIQAFVAAAESNLPNLRHLSLDMGHQLEWAVQYIKSFPQLSKVFVE